MTRTAGDRFPRRALLGGALGVVLTGAVASGAAARTPVAPPRLADVRTADPDAVAARYAGLRPAAWGTDLPGVLRRTPVRTVLLRGRQRPVACLTFDACGNPGAGDASNGFDTELIAFLRRAGIPATLFISYRWAVGHPRATAELARDHLFEIGNHGTAHRPVTVDGRTAYGRPGTGSAAGAVKEVWQNTRHLEKVTGRRPTLFRSGTAHYDDVGVAIVRSLGQLPVGFARNLDFGATASASVVQQQVFALTAGGIGLGHVNRPAGSTAEGVRAAVGRMRDQGFVFKKVSDVLRH